MKSFTSAVLSLLLAGCVTYYYPAPQISTSSVPGTAPYSGGYSLDRRLYPYETMGLASSAYYPWWSLDYFYLGRGYAHSGWSFGFSYGYPYYDFYYPWYGYPVFNFAWYAPYPHHYHHHHYYGWDQPYWHYRYRNHYGRQHHPYGYRLEGGHDGPYAGSGQRNGDVLTLSPDSRNAYALRGHGEIRPVAGSGYTRDRVSSGGARSDALANDDASARRYQVISESRAYASRDGFANGRRSASPGAAPLQPVSPPAGPSVPAASSPDRRKGTFSVVATPEAPRRSSTLPGEGWRPGPIRTQPVEHGSAWVTSMPPPSRATRSAPVAQPPSSARLGASPPPVPTVRGVPGYGIPGSGGSPGSLRPAPVPGYAPASAGPSRPSTAGAPRGYAGRGKPSADRPPSTRTRGVAFDRQQGD